MTEPRRERYQQLLDRVAAHLPADTTTVRVRLPHTIGLRLAELPGILLEREAVTGTSIVAGHHVEIRVNTDTRDDTLQVEWHTRNGGGGKLVQHITSLEQGLDRGGERLYHLARRRGRTMHDALDIAVRHRDLDGPAQEIYTRLVLDGTPAGQAEAIAVTVL